MEGWKKRYNKEKVSEKGFESIFKNLILGGNIKKKIVVSTSTFTRVFFSMSICTSTWVKDVGTVPSLPRGFEEGRRWRNHGGRSYPKMFPKKGFERRGGKGGGRRGLVDDGSESCSLKRVAFWRELQSEESCSLKRAAAWRELQSEERICWSHTSSQPEQQYGRTYEDRLV